MTGALYTYLVPGYARAFFDAIAAALGRKLVVDSRASGPSGSDNPLLDGRADLAWMCSTAYVRLVADRPGSVTLAGVALAPVDEAGAPVYYSCVVARADSGADGLTAFHGRTIAANDPSSLSGYLALAFEVEARGQRADDHFELHFTGGHHRSLDALRRGTVDAALVDSVILAQRARDDPAIAALRVAQRLGPWPTQPLVAGPSLDGAARRAVRDALVEAANGDALREACRATGLHGLASVDARTYEPVLAAWRRHVLMGGPQRV